MRRPAVTTDAPPAQPTGTPVREEPDEQAADTHAPPVPGGNHP
jgi:hypothetical protein